MGFKGVFIALTCFPDGLNFLFYDKVHTEYFFNGMVPPDENKTVKVFKLQMFQIEFCCLSEH